MLNSLGYRARSLDERRRRSAPLHFVRYSDGSRYGSKGPTGRSRLVWKWVDGLRAATGLHRIRVQEWNRSVGGVSPQCRKSHIAGCKVFRQAQFVSFERASSLLTAGLARPQAHIIAPAEWHRTRTAGARARSSSPTTWRRCWTLSLKR